MIRWGRSLMPPVRRTLLALAMASFAARGAEPCPPSLSPHYLVQSAPSSGPASAPHPVQILTAQGAPKDISFYAILTDKIAFAAAISRDGKLLAYCNPASGGSEIRLRDLPSGMEHLLVGPVQAQCEDIVLADDGQLLFYSLKLNGADSANIYRFALPDGPASLVAQDVQTTFTVSPKGDSVAFLRRVPNPKRPKAWLSQLIVARTDHSAERVAATDNSVDNNHPALAGPAWSPSGDQIAFARVEFINGIHLALLDVASGHQHSLGNTRWTAIKQIHWMRGNTGLAVLGVGEIRAGRRTSFQPSLWFVAFPFSLTKDAQQITDDPASFFDLSSTSATDLIVPTSVPEYSVDIVPMADQSNVVHLHPNLPRARYQDLAWVSSTELGVAFPPEVAADPWKIIKFSAAPGSSPAPHAEPEILRCAARTPLTIGSAAKNREATIGGLTVALEELNAVVLSDTCACLPDGRRTAIYPYAPASRLEGVLVGGSAAARVASVPLNAQVFQAALSSDGDLAATFEVPSAKTDPARLLVYDARRNHLLATIDLPGSAADLVPGANLAWAPDGKGVAFLLQRDGHTNLWVQPFSSANLGAQLPATQLTHLREGLLTGFAFSPDGRQVAFSYDLVHFYVLGIAGVR
jgi:Tol biopolymer transport system component